MQLHVFDLLDTTLARQVENHALDVAECPMHEAKAEQVGRCQLEEPVESVHAMAIGRGGERLKPQFILFGDIGFGDIGEAERLLHHDGCFLVTLLRDVDLHVDPTVPEAEVIVRPAAHIQREHLLFHSGMQAICVHEVHIAQLTHEVLARVLAFPEGQVDDGLRAHLRDDEEREGLFCLLHALHQIDQVGALLLFCRAHVFELLARVRVGLVIAGAQQHFVMHPVLSGFVT